MLGIDLGASSIKIVEISGRGAKKKLENYGQLAADFVYKKTAPGTQLQGLFDHIMAPMAIRAIIKEARMKGNQVVFSIPDITSFCITFDIPKTSEKAMEEAVRRQAAQYVPMPIDEVVLDWGVIGFLPQEALATVFVVATPDQVIQEYRQIAKDAGLQLVGVESEALAAARSVVWGDVRDIILVDIGVKGSTVSLAQEGILKQSYSISIGASQLVKMSAPGNVAAPEITSLLPGVMAPLVGQIKTALATVKAKPSAGLVIGGAANVSGLKEYFSQELGLPFTVPNCFRNMAHPPQLTGHLQQISPEFAVAVGVALGATLY